MDIDEAVIGLGWFLRRSEDPIGLAAAYETALGLPRLRSWDVESSTGAMLWIGLGGVLETNRASPDPSFTPKNSPIVPVFRTYDLELSADRAINSGFAEDSRSEDARAAIVFLRDPVGFPLGLEQVAEDSRLLADRLALRRHAADDLCLPGEIYIEGPVQGLSRIIHRAPDIDSESAFLEILGCPRIEDQLAVLHTVADHCIVDLRKDDLRPAAITDRTQAPDSWILRTASRAVMQDAHMGTGRRLLSEHHFAGGDLDYVLTPNNRLIGWQQRKPYDPDVPTTQMIEDLYATTLARRSKLQSATRIRNKE